ncbi:hypothetical protein MMC12_007938 [Toensbergia leucococca]|nr:hypothetical protein [Toensbergia leucococca]
MMMSYACTTATSWGEAVRYFYSIAPKVAGVLADQTTVTPPGFTSLATVMVRTFAVASLPDSTSSPLAATSTVFTSVPVTASRTSTIASPSSTPTSNTRLNTPTIAGIFVAALIIILILALGVWYYLRCRKRDKSKLGVPSSRSSIQQLPNRSGLATHSSLGSMQQPGCYTIFPWSPVSVDANESASQMDQPATAKSVYNGLLAPSKPASQSHDDRSARMLRGLKGGASPLQDVPSDLSPPCCTQPSF